MKKTFLFAALAALSMVSCTNNELPEAEPGYGYINVNVSNDVTVTTRAAEGGGESATNNTVTDLRGWTVTATSQDNTTSLNSLTGNAVLAGSYTVDARTATDMETATTTDSYGIAYYQGEATNVSVTAGQTATANIACGKAKNSKLTLVNNLNSSVFTEVTLHATKGSQILTLPNGNNTSIYYNPSTETTYYITYRYNGETDVRTLKNGENNFTINIAQAGTDYQIILTSTDNGKINLNITYQDFTVSGTDFTFDAATGTGSQN